MNRQAAELAKPRYQLAPRMARISTSVVREILKVTERPEIISFAGGLPAPELFPVQALAEAHAQVFAENGAAALQYSATEGYWPLRQWISDQMSERGIPAEANRVLITSGSQQGIDLVSKVFLAAGDPVIVENPCYLAALQTFSGFEASLIPVGSDDQGMRVDEVERAVRRNRPRLIYVVPNFHNPKGTTLSLARREQLIALSRRHRIPILEDDPYGELRYRGERVRSLASMDQEGLVIYLSTFSKTLSPGIRIGWAIASEEIIQALTIAKQASDLHTSTLLQQALARMLLSFDYPGHLERLRKTYGERCAAMLDALKRHFPPSSRWTDPDGGLFIWAELPRSVRCERLLRDALSKRVAFVPGASFFARAPAHQFMRLNFSNRSPEVIESGIERLGEAVKKRLRQGAGTRSAPSVRM